jgi:hypothetical protein
MNHCVVRKISQSKEIEPEAWAVMPWITNDNLFPQVYERAMPGLVLCSCGFAERLGRLSIVNGEVREPAVSDHHRWKAFLQKPIAT